MLHMWVDNSKSFKICLKALYCQMSAVLHNVSYKGSVYSVQRIPQ